MFSIGKLSSSSSSHPVYFDVRLKSPYKNIVLIQGTPLEASAIPISGHLVFSIPESISVKNVTLKLVGTFKLEFLQVGHHKNSSLASIVKERRTIFECVWDNLLVSSEAHISVGDPNASDTGSDVSSGSHSRTHMMQSLSNPTINTLWKPKRSHSSAAVLNSLPKNGVSCTPFDGASVAPGHTFVLEKGNYELPFKVSLPPDIAETIEGLQAGSVLYKFESNMERGGFKNAFTKHKYLRIFRTLSPNNLAVGEEVSVGKSWADRLQYEISIPSRAIPIGGVTPITVRLYPFQKGYELQKIDANLIQYYAFKDQNGQLYDDESVVFHQVMKNFDDLTGCDTLANNAITDKVELNSSLHLPTNLKQVTQDCDIAGDSIRVRHKLSIKISLKKRVGDEVKKTEIKANIPVFLYISPHVPVEGRLVLLDNAGKIHFRSGDGVPLFEKQALNSGLTSSVSLNNLHRLEDGGLSVSYFPEEDTEAPPTYAKHVYDQLYEGNNDRNQLENLRSGSTTPIASSTMRAITESMRRELSLDNLNRVPSYEQTLDEAIDEAALPVCDLTPSYEKAGSFVVPGLRPSGNSELQVETQSGSQSDSQTASRAGSGATTPEPLSLTARHPHSSIHGGLAHFVRAQVPDWSRPSIHARENHGPVAPENNNDYSA